MQNTYTENLKLAEQKLEGAKELYEALLETIEESLDLLLEIPIPESKSQFYLSSQKEHRRTTIKNLCELVKQLQKEDIKTRLENSIVETGYATTLIHAA